MAPYRLAETIDKGSYLNVLYFEFHNHLDPENEVYESNRLSAFHEESKKYYSNFICKAYPDEYEAVIDVAVNLGGQWFVFRECGANFYFGFGPQGILQLRKACTLKSIPIIVLEEKIDDWLNQQTFGSYDFKQNEFDLIVNIIRNMSADFERRQSEYQNIKEESIRDRLLAPINASVNGRANGEAKNGKGKTDILIRTERGDNEYIFELKVWKGITSLNSAINQLSSYLSWNNSRCGIVMISYNKEFSRVLNSSKKLLQERFEVIDSEIPNEREFRFRLWNNSDKQKHVDVTLMFINLCV